MIKPHEMELRWQEGTRSIQWGGLPVASNVEPEFGPLLGAASCMARELLHLVRLLEPLERDGGLDVQGLATLNGARAALKKAGVL